MSPRTLFIIIIRVIGIYSFKASVIELFELIPYFLRTGQFESGDFLFKIIIIQSVVVTAYFLVTWVLIFKAAYIVDRFELARDLPQTLHFSLDTRNVLRIALVIMAALLLVAELPPFISSLLHLFESQDQGMFGVERKWYPMVISGVKVVIGFLLIGERKRILDLLLQESPNNPVDLPVEEQADKADGDLFPQDRE